MSITMRSILRSISVFSIESRIQRKLEVEVEIKIKIEIEKKIEGYNTTSKA
jgi:hypothetical protein